MSEYFVRMQTNPVCIIRCKSSTDKKGRSVTPASIEIREDLPVSSSCLNSSSQPVLSETWDDSSPSVPPCPSNLPSSFQKNSSQPAVRLKMFHHLVSLLVLIILPSSQPLPAEGWETYAFNSKLLSKVCHYEKEKSDNELKGLWKPHDIMLYSFMEENHHFQDLPNLASQDADRATNCKLMLCIRDSSPTNSTYPWLINNNKARFNYWRLEKLLFLKLYKVCVCEDRLWGQG